MADTLSIYDDMVFLAFLTALYDIVNKLLLVVIIFLRDQDILSTVCDTAPYCKVSGVTSHNLDDTASLMGCGCITYLVNSFHSCIYSSIETDGVLGTCDIKVNSSRQANGIDSKVRKFLSTCEGTVSTDNNKAVDPMLSADLCSLLLSFLCSHLCTSGSIKNCSASLNRIGNVSCCHISDLFI